MEFSTESYSQMLRRLALERSKAEDKGDKDSRCWLGPKKVICDSDIGRPPAKDKFPKTAAGKARYRAAWAEYNASAPHPTTYRTQHMENAPQAYVPSGRAKELQEALEERTREEMAVPDWKEVGAEDY